jgi:putative flippase GtrA
VVVRQVRSLYLTFQSLIHEIAKFGVVGAINYVIDVGIFNALLLGPLGHKPVSAKAASTLVAATLSYFMNRHWTWRHRARTSLAREYGLFILLSAIALGLTVGCLGFGEYVVHQHSLLARNIWGNIVGVGVATIWRFWSFKRWVFLDAGDDANKEAAELTIRTTV